MKPQWRLIHFQGIVLTTVTRATECRRPKQVNAVKAEGKSPFCWDCGKTGHTRQGCPGQRTLAYVPGVSEEVSRSNLQCMYSRTQREVRRIKEKFPQPQLNSWLCSLSLCRKRGPPLGYRFTIGAVTRI